jgi:murein L,D-transpeptidase YafK
LIHPTGIAPPALAGARRLPGKLPLALLSTAMSDAHAATPPTIDLVRVDKSARTLSLLSRGRVVATFHVALGGDPGGHKRQEGDRRTPEGRYMLDFKKADSAFHRAIRISYPNAADIESAQRRGVKPGGAIMVHGQKNGLGWLSAARQRFDWTDGCIALSNADMRKVWDMVQVPTPIEISP